MAFMIFIFFKVQFEANFLETCTNFFQCCGVTLEVLYCLRAANKSKVLRQIGLPHKRKNLLYFEGRL